MQWEDTWKWTNLLGDVEQALNNSVNSRLGLTPNEASERKNRSAIFYKSAIEPMKAGLAYKFKVGDIVRILTDEPYRKS